VVAACVKEEPMRTTKMINQTFTENADGSLTARSYDVGPYETIVLTLDGGEPTGEGGGVMLYFTSNRK